MSKLTKMRNVHCRVAFVLLLIFSLSSHLCFAQLSGVTMPATGYSLLTMANGVTYVVYDNGGIGNYSNNCNGGIILQAPVGATISVDGIMHTALGDVIRFSNGTFNSQTQQFTRNSIVGYGGTSSIHVTSTSNYYLIEFISTPDTVDSGFELLVKYNLPCQQISNVYANVGSTQTTIQWSDNSTATSWQVHYGTSKYNLDQVATTSSRQLTLTNLQEGSTYYYRVFNNRGTTPTSSCQDTAYSFITPCSSTTLCEDFTNLAACGVRCFTGNTALVDVNEGVDTNRHKVITTQGLDPFSDYQLNMIPPGETSSIRLGDQQPGFGQESMLYEYHVDTSVYDMLVLKYAAVLEDPNDHTPAQKPRFKFAVLNSNMQPINPGCYSADYIAGSNTDGWSTGIVPAVLWKDWTTVGVDLSPLHGQTIYIRLSTYDCDKSAHRGYAYFTLNCGNKVVRAANCGNVVSNTFTAPSGFTYRWYREGSPSSTLGTSQSISVNSAGTYCCDMTMIGATSQQCGLTMKAIAGFRYPYARMNAALVDSLQCDQGWQFYDRSVVTTDEAHTSLTTAMCDDVEWDFGDGSTSTERNPLHIYTVPGNYQVKLIASLGNGSCQDTTFQNIHVTSPCHVFDTVRAILCQGTGYMFYDTIVYDAGTYQRDSEFLHHTLIVTINPVHTVTLEDTIVEDQLPYTFMGRVFTSGMTSDTIHLFNSFGCDSTVILNLHVYPNVSSRFDTTICSGQFPITWKGHQFSSSDSVTFTVFGIHGEDSVVTLVLKTSQPRTATIVENCPQNQLPWTFNNRVYNSGCQHDTIHLTTLDGCDSIIDYSLNVWMNVDVTLDTTICSNHTMPFVWNGMIFTAAGTQHLILSTTHGADSTVHLILHINPISTASIQDTVVQNQLPWVFNGNTYTSSVSHDTIILTAANGCDSIIDYSIHVWNNAFSSLDTIICSSQIPLVWNNVTFTGPGTQTVTIPSVHGTDSLITMTVLVNNSYAYDISAAICDDTSYFFNNQVLTQTGYYPMELSTIDGCDSIITLALQVNPTNSSDLPITSCDSYNWNGITYDSSTTQVFHYTNRFGCDSIERLILTINYSTSSEFEDAAEVVYVWGTESYHESGIYHQTFTNQWGCDSLVTLDLTIVDHLPIIYTYDKRLLMVDHYPNNSTERVDFAAYRWYRDGNRIAYSSDDHYSEPGYPILHGCYYVMVPTSPTMMRWVKSNTICMDDLGIDESDVSGMGVMISPNPVSSGNNININIVGLGDAVIGSLLRIFDNTGRLLESVEVIDSNMSINIPYQPGVYCISILGPNGQHIVKKIIVY